LIPTTDLLADLVFQLNDVADSAVALARVRWRYQPGSDVFLVYREDIPLESARDNTRSLVLKLSYRFESAL
jgi:hypothetical protein